MQRVPAYLLNNLVERPNLWLWKNLNLFRVKLMPSIRTKTSKEIPETTNIGLKTVQCINNNRKEREEIFSTNEECGWRNIFNDRYWQTLKCLVKSTVELTHMFNNDNKSISTCTVTASPLSSLILINSCHSVLLRWRCPHGSVSPTLWHDRR